MDADAAQVAGNGIRKLEAATESPGVEIDVGQMVREYRKLYPDPIWRLVEDIERQAMLWSNIIDQIKSGVEASTIRDRFQKLAVVPGANCLIPTCPLSFREPSTRSPGIAGRW